MRGNDSFPEPVLTDRKTGKGRKSGQNDSMRYLLYNKPTDMRKSYHTLCGLVTNELGCDPCNGDVYIFINKARNRIKLLHWEPGGLVLYCKLLESGTFGKPSGLAKDAVSGRIEWSELVMVVEGIIEQPDSRRQRLENLKKLRR